MASIGSTIKREATVVAWTTLISTATGENPVIVRKSNGVDIKWKPGQASKMETYLSNIAFPKKGSGTGNGNGLNVNVDLKPVIIPLVLKKAWIWVTLYTVGIVVATKLLSK